MLSYRWPAKPLWLWVGLAAFWFSQPLSALWLNTYGSSGDELSATQMLRLADGGYVVSGLASTNGQPVHWYGGLDEQGQLLWSKTTGEVSLSFDLNGTVRLQGTALLENATVTVSAMGTLDAVTGDIANLRIENNLSISGNNGQLLATGVEGMFAGTVKSVDGNTDAVLAKISVDRQLLWSRSYDFARADNVPALYALDSGYLLMLSSYTFNPQTYVADWVYLLAKLDADGKLIPGTIKQLSSGFGLYAATLQDGSVVLSNHNFSGEFVLYKLDQKLNYVWGKRFYSPEHRQALMNSSVSEGSDGQLEVHPYMQSRDADSRLSGQHALAIVLNPNDGSIVSKTMASIGEIDAYPFTETDQAKYRLFGATAKQVSDLQPNPEEDGLFGLFNNNFQPEWTKTIAGTGHDHIDLFQKTSATKNYLLAGNTQSWGSGQGDLLFAKLDQKGSIAGCEAIKEVNTVLTEPDIAVQNLSSPLSVGNLADVGAVGLNVSSQQYPFEFKASDYPMTVTRLCQAEDVLETVTETPVTNAGTISTETVSDPTPASTGSGAASQAPDTVAIVDVPSTVTDTPVSNIDTGDLPQTTVVSSGTINQEIIAPVSTSTNKSSAEKLSETIPTSVSPTPQSADLPVLSASQAGLGEKLSINGQAFGKQKGKVLIGNKAANLLSWSDKLIQFKVPGIKAGEYAVSIVVKSKALAHELKLTVNPPQIDSIKIGQKAKASIQGRYFGILAKPKVYLTAGKTRKQAAVLPAYNDNSLTLKLPKLKPGLYQVLVNNAAGNSDGKANLQIE